MLELEFKRDRKNWKLDQDRISIGRDDSNDIVLGDDRVSGFHANIIRNLDKFEIVDLGSSNGTFINNEYLKGRRELKPWDRISFAGIEAEVKDTEGRRPTMVQPVIDDSFNPRDRSMPLNGQAKLTALEPCNGVPVSVTIGQSLTIGRSDENGLCLDMNTISFKHAQIKAFAQGFEIQDMGSTNGTFVNGTRVRTAVLKHGDTVAFDQMAYRLECEEETSAKTVIRRAVPEESSVAATQVTPSIRTDGGPEDQVTGEFSGVKMRSAAELVDDQDAEAETGSWDAAPGPGSEPGPETPAHSGMGWLFFSSQGRIGRLTFFGGVIGVIFAAAIASFALAFSLGSSLPNGRQGEFMAVFIIQLLTLYPFFCLYAKRLHDLDKDAWPGMVLCFIGIANAATLNFRPDLIAVAGILSLVGTIFFLYLQFAKGSSHANRFGLTC